MDELAIAWDSAQSVVLRIARFTLLNENLEMDTAATSRWQSADSVLMVDDQHNSQIRVATGEFDGDEPLEVVVAYWAKDSTVRVALFDIDTSLAITLLDSTGGERLVYTFPQGGPMHGGRFSALTTGDVDGDGLDEILLGGVERVADSVWNVFVRCYDYGNGSLTAKAKVIALSDTYAPAHVYIGGLSVWAGRVRNRDRDDVLVSVAAGQGMDTAYQYVVPVELSADLSIATVIAGATVVDTGEWSFSHGMSEPMATGADLDGDGSLEVVSVGPCAARTYSMGSDGHLQPISEFFSPFEMIVFNGCFIPLATDVDFRADSLGRRPELCMFLPMGAMLDLYSLPTSAADSLSRKMPMHWLSVAPKHVTAGDFDGNIRLEAPRKYTYDSIVEPMVILNAPPVHFDVFNETAYDVSLCYNDNTPQFYSYYATSTSGEVEVERTYNRDWGVSAAASAEVKGRWGIVKAKVKAELTAEYGEKFSKTSSTGQTYTLTVETYAKEENWIYATMVSYDMWEYPVYYNDVRAGNVIVVEPAVVEDRWFPSKSWSAYTYVPDHEVGNILSYPAPSELAANPLVDELVKGSYGNSFVLNGNSSHMWSLQFTDFSSTGASTTKESQMGASLETEVSTYFGGVELEVSGSYGSSDISTRQTSVENGLGIAVQLDHLDMGVGEVRYTVTPYAYWATNGALTLDFAVRPELAPPGGTPTWWQARYGERCDATFILPWKYDPEKGDTLQDEAKREQTKDIILLPKYPEVGDTVTIRARVRNFALRQSPRPVGVRFYVGDPDSGGMLITGLDGSSIVYTAGELLAQDMKEVEMQWQVPAGIGAYPRIYGVIDPRDSIPEVHENNNKGWAILGATTGTPVAYSPGVHRPEGIMRCVRTGPAMVITFHLNRSERLNLSLFDMRGREVERLISGSEYAAGTHRVVLRMDGGDCRADGALILVARTGNELWARKMLFVR